MLHPLNSTIRFGESYTNSNGPAETKPAFTNVDLSKNQLSKDQLAKMPPPMSTATVVDLAAPAHQSTPDTKYSLSADNSRQPAIKTAVQPPPYENPPHYSEHDGTKLPPYSKKDSNATSSEQAQSKTSPPTKSPLPAKKPLSEQLQSMSETERNKLIAKLIDIVGHQQAQLNEQQAQLDDFFEEQHYHLNAPAQGPVKAQTPNNQPILSNNPFLKPEAKAAAASAAEQSKKAWYHYVLDFFPAKYMKNLPMNFLESFVQNAGATMGSNVAHTCHEKYIHPLIVKKPPPPKKTPVKNAFQDAAKVAPELALRAIFDNTAHGIVNFILRK